MERDIECSTLMELGYCAFDIPFKTFHFDQSPPSPSLSTPPTSLQQKSSTHVLRPLFTRLVANHALYSGQVTRNLSKICTVATVIVISAATPARGDPVMGEGDSKAVSTLETEAPTDTR